MCSESPCSEKCRAWASRRAYPPRYVERRLGVAQEVALAAEAAALVVAHPTLCSGAGVQLVQLVRVRVRVGVGVRVRVRVSRG